MAPRKTPRPKKVIPIRTDGKTEIQNWAVLGLDLSLSNTGYAAAFYESGSVTWGHIGAFTPDKPSKDAKKADTWARAQAISVGIGMVMESIWQTSLLSGRAWGLCVVLEYPDPTNSYLMGINQVVQSSIWNHQIPYFGDFTAVYRMSVNASTLRSVMGIKGGTDKKENHRVASGFIPAAAYPNMDEDACDAVLLCRYAMWGLDLLQGRPNAVPLPAQLSLAKEGTKLRLSGSKRVPVPAGLLYDDVLWTRMTFPTSIILKQRDAAQKKARLDAYPLNI